MRRFRGADEFAGALALCLLCLALYHIGSAGVIQAKAWLAPRLIERAWNQTLDRGGRPVRPWPWADTWPVARLRAPGHGVDRLVLAGDRGNALAFGPGHALASAPLGSRGVAVIGGHRDTHFAFLEQLHGDDALQLQLPDGRWRKYHVAGSRIANAERETIALSQGREQLLLVTCYPFDALRPGGPLRYVVAAYPDPHGAASTPVRLL